MKILSGTSNPSLSKSISKYLRTKLVNTNIKKFSDGEIYVEINENNSFNFDLRGFVIKKFKDCGVSQIDNINLDSFATKSEYFSHRRAKKLKENDYGRCISVIKKTSSQN